MSGAFFVGPSDPACISQFADLRAADGSFEVAGEHKPDIAAFAADVFDGEACYPPAAVHLSPFDLGHMRHRIAQPHQHELGSQCGVHPDVVVLHLQRDHVCAERSWKLIEQRIGSWGLVVGLVCPA